MYRSILVPLDGSAFGEYALAPALSLARRSGAQLHLAHVHVMPVPTPSDENNAQRRASEQMYLEGLVQRLHASWDVPITTTLLEGSIAEALHEYALTVQADLLVMTTHGRGALSRFWLGSIADTLIRRMPMPMLLVRPQAGAPDLARDWLVPHILIPLDGSPLAEQMLAHATTLGRLVQAEYTLLQVVDPPIVADEEATEELRVQAESYLERVAAALGADQLQVRTATRVDEAALAILDYAQTHAVDLIALETHGRSGLARWLVGGVADKVVRGASVPVLLHRPEAEDAR